MVDQKRKEQKKFCETEYQKQYNTMRREILKVNPNMRQIK